MIERQDALIRVFQDSRKLGECRDCEGLVDWYETLGRRHLPLNVGAEPRRTEPEGGEGSDRVVAFFAASDSHWHTCTARQHVPTTRPRR